MTPDPSAGPLAPRSIGALAAATPADRDRVVDLVRAIAVTVVVVWHTTLSLLYVDAGRLIMRNPIDVVPGMWALTWALQVMPVFFVVGGYVHLLAWRSTPATGAFLRRRAGRLGRPLVPFVGLWAVAEVGLLLAGRPPLLVTAPALFTPLWFLVVYAAVAAAVPLTARWHDRWGVKVVITGAALLVALDLLRLGGVALAGVLTTALVWLLCHQLGYLWRDGVVHGRRQGLLLAAGAVAGLALLTGPGPYAPSMVASAVHESNMLPTTPPILLVGVLQLGLVLALHAPLARLMQRPRWWRPVVAVNALAMSIYLWHMAAALILMVVVERIVGPTTRMDAVWWWTRPLWLVAVLVVLLGLLVVVRRWEAPHRAATPRSAHPLEHRRQALATADAHGLQAVAGVAAVHLAGDGGEDAGAGGADGVAQRDPGAVDVDTVEVRGGEFPFPGDGEGLGGERLVELDQVDVGEGEPGGVERRGGGGGGDGADAHRGGRHSAQRPRHQPHQRAQPELGGSLGSGDDAGGGAVVLP